MNELTERQKLILTLIIHEYARSAAPVGSQMLVERYQLNLSSATIRNEMVALTDMGYLRSPHTSAGRVPTEDGYRYFVGHLVQSAELPLTTRRMISHQFYQTRHDIDQWMRLAASVLANQSHQASLITAPHPEKVTIKHLELISTRGRQVLMVLVMTGGEIRQRFITLEEPVSQEILSGVAARLNRQVQGKQSEEVRNRLGQFSGLERDFTFALLDEMADAEALVAGEVYLDGLTNVLAQPEFAASEEARRALRVLEERSALQVILSRTLTSEHSEGVQVLIGGEGTLEELRSCSIILARYGSPGLAMGTLGVLGPIRMPYGHTISVVRYVSGLLSEMVSENLIDEISEN